MAKYKKIDWTKYATKDAGYSFNRNNPIPLDKTSIFNTLAEAEAYASGNPLAFAGQIVSVVTVDENDNVTSVKAYQITGEGTLTEMAASASTVSQIVEGNGIKVSNTGTSYTVTAYTYANDNVLSVDANGIKTTLSIDYDSTNRKIQLKGRNGEFSYISADPFIKDGVLWGQQIFTCPEGQTSYTVSITKDSHTESKTFENLTAGNQYLAMCFKNISGGSITYSWELLDLSSLIDKYTAGDGINISDTRVVSVKKDTNSESFLTISSSGVKLAGVQTAINTAYTNAKTYTSNIVDALNLTEVAYAGAFISKVSQANGKVSAAYTEFATEVTNGNGIAPSSTAVWTYVGGAIKGAIDSLDASFTNTVAGITYTITQTDGKLSKVNLSVTAGTVASGNTNVVTGGTVHSYVVDAINALDSTVSSDSTNVNVSVTQTDGKLSSITVSEDYATVSYYSGIVETGEQIEPTFTVTNSSYLITGQDLNTLSYYAYYKANLEGNKAYATAKKYTDDLIDTLDLTEVTYADGFVSKVSQANGKVSATAAKFADSVTSNGSIAPKASAVYSYVGGNVATLRGEINTAYTNAKTYTSTVVDALKLTEVTYADGFVSKVSQANGKVSATATKFADSVTSNGSIAPKASAVWTYVSGNVATLRSEISASQTHIQSGNGISVAYTGTTYTVTAVAYNGDNILSVDTNGITSTLEIKYDSTSREIRLVGNNSTSYFSYIDASPFIKDGILYGQKVFKATAASQEIEIKGKKHTFTNLTVGHAYLAMCFSNGEAASTTYSWDIIDVNDLVDVYTAGNGLSLTSGKFAVKTGNGLEFDSSYNVAVKKDTNSESFLTISSSGVKLAGVQTAINTAYTNAKTYTSNIVDALNLTEVAYAGAFISKVSQANGKVSAAYTEFAADVTNGGGIAPSSTAVLTYVGGAVKGAINALDSTVSSNSTNVNVSVTQTDGKLSSITVSEDYTNAYVKAGGTDEPEFGIATGYEGNLATGKELTYVAYYAKSFTSYYIGTLNVSATTEPGYFVTSVSQTNGIISVSKAKIVVPDISVNSYSTNYLSANGHEIGAYVSTLGEVGLTYNTSTGKWEAPTSATTGTGLSYAANVAEELVNDELVIAAALNRHETSLKEVETWTRNVWGVYTPEA